MIKKLVKKFILDFSNTKSEEFEVFGIGNAIIDFVFFAKNDDFITKFNLQRGLMNQITQDEFKHINDYFSQGDQTTDFCGSIANTITTLNTLGTKSLFISSVGSDKYGDLYSSYFNKNGSIATYKSLNTSKSAIIITNDGQRTMCTSINEQMFIDFDEIEIQKIQAILNAKIFIIESYLFYNDKNLDIIEKLCIFAKSSGCIITISLSDKNCVKTNKQKIINIIEKYCDIVIGNVDEINQLDHVSSSKLVVTTMSQDGAMAKIEDAKIYQPLVKQVNVVDTTGAGDVFLAAFLHYLIKNKLLFKNPTILKKSLEYANLHASQIVSQIGTKLKLESVNIGN
jgi:sugar/nucleoside kinase (ribokinase family)